MSSRRPLAWLIVAALLAAAGGATLARMLSQKQVMLHSGTWLPQRRSLAAFSLADTGGGRFGNAQLAGHPSLVFFGFTACPDVCPTTLATMAALGRTSPLADLHLLFVSVDPERDSPAALRTYLASFDPHVVGLVGDRAALQPLLQSLGAIAERRPAADGSYTVDHSATLYLLDRSGRMAAIFSPPIEIAGLRADFESIARSASL